MFELFNKKKVRNTGAPSPTIVEKSTQIGGQKVAYLRAGPKDKAIVFIHGNSACKEAFSEQFKAVLEAGYGLLALDLPGHGASADASDPGAQYTIPAYAKIITKLCAQLEIDKPLLCGWSLGGHIAIELAAGEQDCCGLMFFGTPPVGPGLDHLESAFLPSEVSDVTGAEDPPMDRLEAYIAALYGTLQVVPENLVEAGKRADGRSRSSMFNHWASGTTGHNQRQLVNSWRKPILMLHGGDDAFVAGDYFNSLKVIGDGSAPTLKLLPSVGHAPFLEAPDAFNEELLAFAKRCFV